MMMMIVTCSFIYRYPRHTNQNIPHTLNIQLFMNNNVQHFVQIETKNETEEDDVAPMLLHCI